MITAPGYERLITHVFRDGDRYLDSDAVFGVRASLIADWVRHEPTARPLVEVISSSPRSRWISTSFSTRRQDHDETRIPHHHAGGRPHRRWPGQPAHAQQTFKLTIASSHPTTLPWVGLMSSLFVPEVNKRVAALNKGYKIEWREAYGGQLYKMNATLSRVEQGVTDIGWVFHNLEAAKMPLSQFGTVTPSPPTTCASSWTSPTR